MDNPHHHSFSVPLGHGQSGISIFCYQTLPPVLLPASAPYTCSRALLLLRMRANLRRSTGRTILNVVRLFFPPPRKMPLQSMDLFFGKEINSNSL